MRSVFDEVDLCHYTVGMSLGHLSVLEPPKLAGRWPPEWHDETLARVESATVGLPPMRLTGDDFRDVSACGGLFINREAVRLIPPDGLQIRRRLRRSSTLRWIETTSDEEVVTADRHVDQLLRSDDHDSLTQLFLHTLPAARRSRLADALISSIVRAGTDWPALGKISDIRVGPVDETTIADVTFAPDMVDLRVSTSQIGDDHWEQRGDVLVHLAPDAATTHSLEHMALDAVAHSIVTGVPSARLAVFGLISGSWAVADLTAHEFGQAVTAGYQRTRLDPDDTGETFGPAPGWITLRTLS